MPLAGGTSRAHGPQYDDFMCHKTQLMTKVAASRALWLKLLGIGL